MKFFAALALSLACKVALCQEGSIVVPAGTTIAMESTKEIFEKKDKPGSPAPFRVAQDVVVDGVVVIPAKTPVRATVTTSGNRELRVDLHDVKAVDGTVITLADCWIFTTASQNQKSHGAALWVGTKKNCLTAVKATVKATGAKY